MTDLKILDDILLFIEENYLYIACGIIFLIAFYTYLKYDIFKLSSIGKSLKRIKSALDNIKGFDIENVKNLNRVFDGKINKALKQIWNEYHNDFKRMFKQKNCPDIREYFSVINVISFPAGRKKMEIMPGIITTLGILGTFIGLAIAIYRMNYQEDTGTIINIEVLTKGAAFALAISITAIAISIILQVLDRNIYQKTLNRLHMFYSAVEQKIPILSSARSNAIIVSEQLEQTESMWTAVNTINERFTKFSVETLISALSKTYQDSIEKFVKPTIDEMSTKITHMNKETLKSQENSAQKLVEIFTDKFNEATEGEFRYFTRSLRVFTETLGETKKDFEGFLSVMLESLKNQKEVNSATESIIESFSSQNTKMLELENSFYSSVDKMGNFVGNIESLIDSSREMVKEISNQNIQAKEENRERLEVVTSQLKVFNDEMDCGIEGVVAKLTETMENIITKMDENINTTLERLEGNTTTLLDSMDEQVRNIGLYASELNADMGELNSKLESSVMKFGEHISDGIQQTFKGFDDGLAEVSSRLSSIVGEIRDSVEDLPGAITLLKDEISSGRDKK